MHLASRRAGVAASFVEEEKASSDDPNRNGNDDGDDLVREEPDAPGSYTPASFHSLLALVAKEYDEAIHALQAEVERAKQVAGSSPKSQAVTGQEIAGCQNLLPDKAAASLDCQREVVQNDMHQMVSTRSWAGTHARSVKPRMSPASDAARDKMADEDKMPKEKVRPAAIKFVQFLPHNFHLAVKGSRKSQIQKFHMHYLHDFWVPWMLLKFGLPEEHVLGLMEWWLGLREPVRTGWLANIVEHTAFHTIVMIVIVANSVQLTLAVDLEMDTALKVKRGETAPDENISMFELAFTIFYCIELTLHVLVHRLYFFIGKGWRYNMFDLLLVLFSVFDLFAQSTGRRGRHKVNPVFLRSVRFLRVIPGALRMFRAVNAIQELRLMLDCILNSMFHLFWCSMLLSSFLYMFSLILMQGFVGVVKSDDIAVEDQDFALISKSFRSVYHTCVTLFMSTTGGMDWGDVYYFMGEVGTFYQGLFLFQIIFFCVLAWNVVASNMVEKAMRLALPQAEVAMMEKHRLKLQYTQELKELLSDVADTDDDGYLTLEEFKTHLRDHRVHTWFEARELDIKDPELFFHMLSGSGRISLGSFVSACMKLRGIASSLDLQALHFNLHNSFSEVTRRVDAMEDLLGKIFAAQGKLLASQMEVLGGKAQRQAFSAPRKISCSSLLTL